MSIQIRSLLLKNFLLFFSIVLILGSCAKRNNSSTNEESSKAEILAFPTKISPRTKMFLSAYQKEMQSTNKKKTHFEPSAELIGNYSLVKLNDNVFYVKGFASLNANFDKDVLPRLKIKSGSIFGSQTSLHIPLDNFENFLKTDNITYFEIVEKANLKD